MMQLPRGWWWSTVEQVGRVQLGRQRAPKFHTGSNMKPYLRVANVFEDRIDVRDLKYMHFDPDEYDRYRLVPGDLLLNEGQTPELLGRPAIYRGVPDDVAFTNSLIRFQAGPEVDPRWALLVFRHHMHSGRFTRESRITTNIAHLSAARFRTVEFPVPPLDEQRRIVDLLEDHLSRLDAAVANLDAADRRLRAFRSSQLEATKRLAVNAGRVVSLAEVSIDSRYGTSAKCVIDGPGVPVVRIPNLVHGFIDLADEKRVQDATTDMSGFMLEAGDVLVVRTNGSRDLIGRAAVVQPGVDAAFASYLIRYRVDESQVHPLWVRMMLEAPSTREALESMAASSAGQFNLGLKKLDGVTLPVPPLPVQSDLLASSAATHEAVSRLRSQLERARARATGLRVSLLAAAFRGHLTERMTNMQELVHV
jgi:type I restriction enzyme S subunit